jgi:purine-binding chemotaxis protein CheW
MSEPTTHLSDDQPGEGFATEVHEGRQAASLRQYLAFRLAGEQYGIDIHEIVEILKYRPVTPVPHAADLIHGIVSVRGRIITVVDGRRRLGLEAAAVSPASRIIVLRDGEESVGLLVDEVLQVEKLSAESVSAPPNTLTDAAQMGIAGVCETQHDAILILLDREAFLKF